MDAMIPPNLSGSSAEDASFDGGMVKELMGLRSRSLERMAL